MLFLHRLLQLLLHLPRNVLRQRLTICKERLLKTHCQQGVGTGRAGVAVAPLTKLLGEQIVHPAPPVYFCNLQLQYSYSTLQTVRLYVPLKNTIKNFEKNISVFLMPFCVIIASFKFFRRWIHYSCNTGLTQKFSKISQLLGLCHCTRVYLFRKTHSLLNWLSSLFFFHHFFPNGKVVEFLLPQPKSRSRAYDC